MLTLYRLAHVLIAFVWFAAVFAAHWNAMQARRATTWATRATLFSVNRDLSTRVALPMLFMVGLVGNIYAMQMGYTMKTSLSFMVANGLWAAMVLVALFVELPAAGALGALAHAAAAANATSDPAGWDRELKRWRAANGAILLGFFLMLGVMISPWAPRP